MAKRLTKTDFEAQCHVAQSPLHVVPRTALPFGPQNQHPLELGVGSRSTTPAGEARSTSPTGGAGPPHKLMGPQTPPKSVHRTTLSSEGQNCIRESKKLHGTRGFSAGFSGVGRILPRVQIEQRHCVHEELSVWSLTAQVRFYPPRLCLPHHFAPRSRLPLSVVPEVLRTRLDKGGNLKWKPVLFRWMYVKCKIRDDVKSMGLRPRLGVWNCKQNTEVGHTEQRSDSLGLEMDVQSLRVNEPSFA